MVLAASAAWVSVPYAWNGGLRRYAFATLVVLGVARRGSLDAIQSIGGTDALTNRRDLLEHVGTFLSMVCFGFGTSLARSERGDPLDAFVDLLVGEGE